MFALQLLAKLVTLLPWEALRGLGAGLGWLAGGLLRIRRRSVIAAMSGAGVSAPARAATAMYASLGAGVFELLWLAGATQAAREAALASRVVLDEDLDAAIATAAARGPVILAASHTGNWELIAYGAARVLAKRGRRLAVVVKPLAVGGFHAFCMHMRRTCGLKLLEPRGAMAAARRCLADGDVLAMPIDQVPDRARHGVAVPFLGAAALADRAPAALARATGATMLVVAASRDGHLQRGHLLATLDARDGVEGGAVGVTHGAWIHEATRTMTRALDAYVLACPASWLWLHRRWRAPLERAPHASAALVATRHPG